MMPTKVTVSGRPVFGNETPDTALTSSSSKHISAHYKRILAARDQDLAKASDIFPDSAEARTADILPSLRTSRIQQAYARTFYSQITAWVQAKSLQTS